MKKQMLLLLMVVLLAFLACHSICFCPKKNLVQDEAIVRKIIEALNEKYEQWFTNGDVDSLANLHTKNACIMPANNPKVCGRKKIREYFVKNLNRSNLDFELTTEFFVVSGQIAVERGSYSLGEDTTGKYLTQWRYKNGKWLIENDIGNTN